MESPSAPVDLSTAISETATGDLATLPGASTVFGFPGAVLLSSVDASQCVFTSSSQSFVCPSHSSNGLTFKASFILLDASGHNQSSLNSSTTSAVRAIADVDGTTPVTSLQGLPASAAIHHHSDLTLSGLLTAPRTLNGTSHDRDTVTSTSGSTTIRSVIDASSTTASLVLSPGSNRFPEAGTITADITTSTTIGSGPAATATAHVIVTFNGTSFATAVITIGSTTRTCQIDLTGGPPRC